MIGLFGLGLVGFGLVLLRLNRPRVVSKVTFARAGANRVKVNMACVFLRIATLMLGQVQLKARVGLVGLWLVKCCLLWLEFILLELMAGASMVVCKVRVGGPRAKRP